MLWCRVWVLVFKVWSRINKLGFMLQVSRVLA